MLQRSEPEESGQEEDDYESNASKSAKVVAPALHNIFECEWNMGRKVVAYDCFDERFEKRAPRDLPDSAARDSEADGESAAKTQTYNSLDTERKPGG